jgi:D-sedoheptulose 7-phosphate isomerase
MQNWLTQYHHAQQAATASIPLEQVSQLVQIVGEALRAGKNIYVFGNGGSASNASHFATDLGKGASDKVGQPFRVFSLNDNVAWMTAISNDYTYEDVFVRQLENYGRAGDVAISLSVSGSSLNCVKALEWARQHGLRTVAIVGGKRGRMAEIAELVLAVNDTHYGRVEDAQMTICHMVCYAFTENPSIAGAVIP